MKRVSTYSLALATAIGAGTMMWATPASAQQNYGTQSQPSTGQQVGDRVNNRRDSGQQEAQQGQTGGFDVSQLSETVRAQAGSAQQMLQGEAPDYAAILQTLNAVVPAVANAHDRYFVGTLLLQLSVAMQQNGSSNEEIIPIQRQGLQLAVDSNLLPREQNARYLRFLGGMAESPAAALQAFEAAAEANPNDAETQIQLARAYFNAGNTAAGFTASERAFEIARQNNLEIDSSWFGVPLSAAYDARDAANALRYGHLWVETVPSDMSWREALRIYQYAGRLGDQANLDALRLMRVTGSLDAEGYDEYVELANRRGFFGEALEVYEEGTTSGGLAADATRRSELSARVEDDRSNLSSVASEARNSATGATALSTADAYVGYGDYASAIELYRLALEKGGVDAGTVNLRLARALYLANRRGEAEQALAAVTGDRSGLARFWEIWLEQHTGAQAEATAEPTGE